MADVGKVLDRGVGVAVALEHHCLALILVEEDFVLERAPILGPHDLHGRLRQALPFLDLAGMKFDPCDSFDLVHCCSFRGSRPNGLGAARVRPQFRETAISVPIYSRSFSRSKRISHMLKTV